MTWSYKEWYQKNKAALSKKRKARYRNDENYRKKVQKWNQESRGKSKKKPNRETPDVVQVGRYRSVTVDGKDYFTIGAVVQQADCSLQALRKWERRGLVSGPDFRKGDAKTGVRLYSAERITEIKKEIEEHRSLGFLLAPTGPHKGPRSLFRKIRFADGTEKKVHLFRFGVLCDVAGQSVSAMSQLERAGLFPRSPLVILMHSKKDKSVVGRLRMYTAEMLEAVRESLHTLDETNDDAAWRAVKKRILTAWEKLGVMGAEVLTVKKK